MVASKGYEQYRQQTVMTASPGELVLMLYDGCIKNVKLARLFMEEKNLQESNEAFKKAQAILSELMKGLDFKYEISEQLYKLYEFLNWELINANIHKDIDKVNSSLEILTEMRDTWDQAIKIYRSNTYAALAEG